MLRYLLFDGPDDAFQTVYRMKNVIFGAICSLHILGAVLKDPTHRFCKKFPEEAEQMSRSMYMDDGIFVADSPEQTKKLMSQAEAFFAKASFASLLADRQQERDDVIDSLAAWTKTTNASV